MKANHLKNVIKERIIMDNSCPRCGNKKDRDSRITIYETLCKYCIKDAWAKGYIKLNDKQLSYLNKSKDE